MAEIVYDSTGPMCLECGEHNPDTGHTCKEDVELHYEDLSTAIDTLVETLTLNSKLWDKLSYPLTSREMAARRIKAWLEQEKRSDRLNAFYTKG